MEYETPCSRPHSLHSKALWKRRGGAASALGSGASKMLSTSKDPASDVLSCSNAYKAYDSSLIKDILSDQHFDLNWTIPSSVTDGMNMKIEKTWFNLAWNDRKLHFATLPLHAFAVASDGVQCKIPQCILPDLMAPFGHSMQTFRKYTMTK